MIATYKIFDESVFCKFGIDITSDTISNKMNQFMVLEKRTIENQFSYCGFEFQSNNII